MSSTGWSGRNLSSPGTFGSTTGFQIRIGSPCHSWNDRQKHFFSLLRNWIKGQRIDFYYKVRKLTKNSIMVSVKLATGLDLRQASISSELSSGQCKSFACFLARSICWVGYGSAFKRDPLITIALWNKFFDIGETMCSHTLRPPTLQPLIVTEFGSPPNAAMFLRIQRSANTWSFKPRLPGACESPVLMKPEIEISKRV